MTHFPMIYCCRWSRDIRALTSYHQDEKADKSGDVPESCLIWKQLPGVNQTPRLAFQRDFAISPFHVLNFLGEGPGIARFLQSMLSYFDFPWTPFKLVLRPSMKCIKLDWTSSEFMILCFCFPWTICGLFSVKNFPERRHEACLNL